MELLLQTLLSYFIGLAANERSSAIVGGRERKLKEVLSKEADLAKALSSTRSIRVQVSTACAELARNRMQFEITPQEQPLWNLLSDDVFQADITEWLMAGAMDEGAAVKSRILAKMEEALVFGSAKSEQISGLKSGFFEMVDRSIFAEPILAQWRHQMSLDYLREQVSALRQLADETAGKYSTAKQNAALDRYCEKALAAWDIIDLSNLPEGDIQMATQKLLLRQLYMPLRIEVEAPNLGEGPDATLARLEERREARRHREAGHLFGDEPDPRDRKDSRAPVGERLAACRRLVVLGDPGGGKTTMLRWMATAYLLRFKADQAFNQIPDTNTLPDRPWIPVLIRCRDLGEAELCRCFADFLTQHLYKTELQPEEAAVMRAVILNRIARGEALLLVDGLDEITNPHVRVMFCQELERTAARYPEASIVVTSRIVGYRDMPYRMGSGFEHGVIAELSREDKDVFAQRWVEVTEQHQTTAERAKRARELLDSLHSTDRIERLTSNPMLLTTLALVKRKVGKLPTRRSKLYAEAVSVLINWNPRIYSAIDDDEAIPQLEYLAYEMCRRGVQRLTGDEVIELLEKLRTEYPNIRAIRSREPQIFLDQLEARSSVLIKAGGIWHKSGVQEKPVWEFRHLTFQEYLAARALLDGRYPGRDKTKSLAAQVAPLAAALEQKAKSPQTEEIEVHESWREALRLLVADCKDDDVEDVLLSILNPLASEDPEKTRRPRAVLAALCLVDEPNIGEAIAKNILSVFVSIVDEPDGSGIVRTPVERTAIEIGASIWSPLLKDCLFREYCDRADLARARVGGLWSMVVVSCWERSHVPLPDWFEALLEGLKSKNRSDAISCALCIMQVAFEEKAILIDGLVDQLFVLLTRESTESLAAVWALLWLNGGWGDDRKPTWIPSDGEIDKLVVALSKAPAEETQVARSILSILCKVSAPNAVSAILLKLDDADPSIRRAAAAALGKSGGKNAVAPLISRLEDSNDGVCRTAIYALGQIGDTEAVPLLTAKLGSQDLAIRAAAAHALGQLADKRALQPLISRLDDPMHLFRTTIIRALVRIGGNEIVLPLIRILSDSDADVQLAAVQALGRIGDKQAVPPLLKKLSEMDSEIDSEIDVEIDTERGFETYLEIRPAIAATLRVLGESKGESELAAFLNSNDPEVRQRAVGAYAYYRDKLDREILSKDIDSKAPWLDPKEKVTQQKISDGATKLNVLADHIKLRYEAMASDLGLELGWKT